MRPRESGVAPADDHHGTAVALHEATADREILLHPVTLTFDDDLPTAAIERTIAVNRTEDD